MPSDADRQIDPITLTLVWNSLISIAEEMSGALRRTAFSEAVREGEDFSAGVFDASTRLVAQGNNTPGHLGAMPYVVKNVLGYVPLDQLEPGDAIVTNDSYLGGGHYPDFYMVTPVFAERQLLGYVVNTAHHVDVGGAAPGSQTVQGVTEAFQEGLRVLPVRLIRKGEFDEDLLRVILGNVRIPEKMRGDLRAQRNANHVGAERLRALYRAHGKSVVHGAIEELLARSEHRTRELISAIPDGDYSFDDVLDDVGPGTARYTSASMSRSKAMKPLSIFPAAATRSTPGSTPISTIPAPIRPSASAPSPMWMCRTTMASSGRSGPWREAGASSIRSFRLPAAGGRIFRSAFSTLSMAHSPRRCPSAPWAHSHTGPIRSSAVSTTRPAGAG